MSRTSIVRIKHDTSTNYTTEALQGLRLIPMTPSPSPVPTPVPLEERSVDSLTPEELQELGKRFHVRPLPRQNDQSHPLTRYPLGEVSG